MSCSLPGLYPRTILPLLDLLGMEVPVVTALLQLVSLTHASLNIKTPSQPKVKGKIILNTVVSKIVG